MYPRYTTATKAGLKKKGNPALTAHDSESTSPVHSFPIISETALVYAAIDFVVNSPYSVNNKSGSKIIHGRVFRIFKDMPKIAFKDKI